MSDVRAPACCVGLVAALTGCPQEPDPDEACGVEGDAALTVSPAGDFPPLSDGDELPVFPPPQGGVFSELDLIVEGFLSDDLGDLRLEVTDGSGTSLADQEYTGGYPIACQEDGSLTIENLPLGYVSGTVLQDLDGVEARLDVAVEAREKDLTASFAVVLRVTGY